jgi:hypothetical protein
LEELFSDDEIELLSKSIQVYRYASFLATIHSTAWLLARLENSSDIHMLKTLELIFEASLFENFKTIREDGNALLATAWLQLSRI